MKDEPRPERTVSHVLTIYDCILQYSSNSSTQVQLFCVLPCEGSLDVKSHYVLYLDLGEVLITD